MRAARSAAASWRRIISVAPRLAYLRAIINKRPSKYRASIVVTHLAGRKWRNGGIKSLSAACASSRAAWHREAVKSSYALKLAESYM